MLFDEETMKPRKTKDQIVSEVAEDAAKLGQPLVRLSDLNAYPFAIKDAIDIYELQQEICVVNRVRLITRTAADKIEAYAVCKGWKKHAER